jgi:serine/threonine protein kinase
LGSTKTIELKGQFLAKAGFHVNDQFTLTTDERTASAVLRHSSASAKGWEPPSIEELSAQLPQYQIEALLGRGGMGAVYKGRQTSLDRPVAIKILPLEMGEHDATYAQRFKNEARAMAKLNHPGIVAVYDFGETSGGLMLLRYARPSG